MIDKDFDKKINEISERAKREKKQELAGEKLSAREIEEQRVAKAELKENIDHQESTAYTAVIVTKLAYKGVNTPSREQLAEELGITIMKWVNQKSFYAINSKEPVPTLVSVDVDIKQKTH